MKTLLARVPFIMHSSNIGNSLAAVSQDYHYRSLESNLDVLISECKWAECGKCFSSPDDLAAHVSSFHSNSGPGGLFYCRWDGCGRGDKGFNARYKMLVHVRTHTNEKPHQCLRCNKCFSRAENLKIHARSHTGERPYVCPVPGCGKAYSNSSDRFKHTRTHSVHKPYVCKIPSCGKRYTDPSSLRKHIKTNRHFQTNFPPGENFSTKNIEKLSIGGDFNGVKIIKIPDISNSSSSETANLKRNYCIQKTSDYSFTVIQKWLKSKSRLRSCSDNPLFPTVFNDNCSCFQEQDHPLDLTVRK